MGLPPLKVQNRSATDQKIPVFKLGFPDHVAHNKTGITTDLIYAPKSDVGAELFSEGKIKWDFVRSYTGDASLLNTLGVVSGTTSFGGGSADQDISQSFLVSSFIELSAYGMDIYRTTATGTFQFKLYRVDGAGVITGAPLHVGDPIDVTTLPGAAGTFTYQTIDGGLDLEPGSYAVVAEDINVAVNFLYSDYDNTNPDANGIAKRFNTGAWIDVLGPNTDYAVAITARTVSDQTDLIFNQEAYLVVPALTRGRNTIDAQTVSLPSPNSVAYISPNLDAGADNVRPVIVGLADSLPAGVSVIARRDARDCIIGNMRLLPQDEFKLHSRPATVPVPIVTEWTSFDPQFSWTTGVASTAGLWRRVGENMEVRAKVVCSGTPTAVALQMNMPTGFQIDTSKMVGPQSTVTQLGWGSVRDTGVNVYPVKVTYNTTTQVNVQAMPDDSGAGGAYTGMGVFVTQAVPISFTTNDDVEIYFSVPIVGWSAGASVSTTENLFRSVDIRAEGNAGTVLTPNVTDIDFTEVEDNINAWNGSQFTAPSSGRYAVEGSVFSNAGAAPNILAFVNGSLSKAFGSTPAAATVHPFSGNIFLNKGDVLSIRSDAAITLANSSVSHHISISVIRDFSTFSVWGETELHSVASSSDIAFPLASSTWGDIASFTVPAGKRDLSCGLIIRTTAVASPGDLSIGISTNPGTSTAGLSRGENLFIQSTLNSAYSSYKTSVIVPSWEVINDVPTTYYLKAFLGNNTNVNLYGYHMRARKIS